jgi:uroporphyrinogen-III synthase
VSRAERRRVWVTRAMPGAEVTAGRVRALGFDAVVAPLLRVRPVGHGPIDLTGIGAIAFTSVNGVEGFAARSAERAHRVFAVGDTTAAAARSAGFTDVLSSEGGVAALAGAIAAHAHEILGGVLHPAAAEVAGDLSDAGVPVRRLTVYETMPTPRDAALEALIPGFHAALLHSAKAARRLAAILREVPAPALRLLCLSPAVAAPLCGEISTAALPSEEALLNLLVDRGFP